MTTTAADFSPAQLRVIRLIGYPGELATSLLCNATDRRTRRYLQSVGVIKMKKPYRPGRNNFTCVYVLTDFGKRIYEEVQGANHHQQ